VARALQAAAPTLPPMPDASMGMVKYSGQIGLLKKVRLPGVGA